MREKIKDLQNILTQVSIISRKNNEIVEAIDGRFNMFAILGVGHYENAHSSIICELLKPKGSHGLKELFLKAFFDLQAKNDQVDFKEFAARFDFENARAYTEYPTPTNDGRIDILIEDTKGHAVIIENKIYAGDQWEQLKRYNSFALHKYAKKENFKIFYLSLNGNEASTHSSEGVDYIPISHSEFIIDWLEQCISLASRYPLVRETMSQYINHLKELTNKNMNTNEEKEIVELISKPENVESAIKISKNIDGLKTKLLYDMAKSIAEECFVEFLVRGKNVGFYKNEQENRLQIWFALDKGRTYCSIKTKDSLNGKANPQQQITELFSKKADAWNPYGYEYVMNDHWEVNSQLYLKMIDGSLANDIIIPNLKKMLNYLNDHPEI